MATTSASAPGADPGARRGQRAADRVLVDATRRTVWRCTALCLSATAAAGAGLLLPAALGRALDLTLRHHRAEAGHWVVLCALLTGAAVVLDGLNELLTGTTAARSTAELRQRLVGHVLSVGPRTTGRFGTGDLVTRAVANSADVGVVPGALAVALASLAAPVGAIVALGLTDPWLAVTFLAGTPALFLLTRAFTRASGDSSARYQQAQGRIADRLTEAIGGARTVAAAATTERETARVLAPLPELSRQGYRVWRILGRASAQTVVLVPMVQIAVLAVAGLRLSEGRISLGDLLAVARYAVLASGIGVLTGQLGAVVRGRSAAGRIADVLAVEPTVHGSRRLPPGDGTLELSGVRFAYDGTTVLREVNLLVPGGTSMAVVGRSGAGKSALAALAGRLADPDDGVVVLDGVPLAEIDRAELRAEVGYAFERPALLGGTLAGTIAFGAAAPPQPDVVRAARAARAHDFVSRLPAGYDTPCADAPLSGGEIQRLGLARAFVRPGRLMVLDDATSSLDTVTEREVSRAILRDTPRGTRLIVAHRAATAARADRVAWLEDGRVRAVAPHARLWQLADYRAVFEDGAGGPAGSGDGTGDGEADG